LAQAGDVSEAALRRLGDGTRKRDGRDRVAAITGCLVRIQGLDARISNGADENRDVDIDRDIPNENLQSSQQTFLHERPANRVFDRLDNYPAIVFWLRLLLFDGPEGCLVALDDLAEAVHNRLGFRVARGQAVRGGEEHAVVPRFGKIQVKKL